jgi:hypothetical protein
MTFLDKGLSCIALHYFEDYMSYRQASSECSTWASITLLIRESEPIEELIVFVLGITAGFLTADLVSDNPKLAFQIEHDRIHNFVYRRTIDILVNSLYQKLPMRRWATCSDDMGVIVNHLIPWGWAVFQKK